MTRTPAGGRAMVYRGLRDSKSVPFIANVLKILEILWPVLGPALGTLLVSLIAIWLKTPGVYFYTAILGGLFVLFLFLTFRGLRNYGKRSEDDLNPKVKITNRISTCRVIDRHKIEYTVDVELIARADNIETFNFKFNWTGAGSKNFQNLTPQSQLISVPVSTLPHDMIRIVFDSPLRRGSQRRVSFNILTDGSALPQRPYYAIDLRYFGKSAHPWKLVLDLTSCTGVVRAWKESYLSPKALWPTDDPEEIDINRTRVIDWDLPQIDGRRHAVCWAYEQETIS